METKSQADYSANIYEQFFLAKMLGKLESTAFFILSCIFYSLEISFWASKQSEIVVSEW